MGPHADNPFAFPLLVLLVLGGLLFLLVGLGKAAARAVAGPADGSSGRGGRGCAGGCGLALVLMFLGALGVVGCAGLLALAAGVAAVEHNPIRKVEVLRESGPGEEAREEERVHLRFEVDHDAGWLLDLVADVSGVDRADLDLRRRTLLGSGGEEVIEVDILLPLDGADLRQVEEELRRELPRLSERLEPGLPEVVRVEFRGAKTDD